MDFEKIFFTSSDYKVFKERRLGKGDFGYVCVAKSTKDKKEYAAKIIDVRDNFDGDDQKIILEEVFAFSKLNHKSIINLIGLNFRSFEYVTSLQPTFITEYASKGSLKTLLENEKKGDHNLEWTITKKYICLIGIADGMRYLHQNKVFNCHLKPEKILFDENFYPKISVFSLSRCFPSIKKRVKITYYLAPEVTKNKKYEIRSDVFSFAMIAYEILTNKTPFESEDFSKELEKGNRPKFTNNIPFKMQELIGSCWSQDPAKRPSFDDIYNKLSSDFSYSPEKINENELIKFIELRNGLNFAKIDSIDYISDLKNQLKDKTPEIILCNACYTGNFKLIEYLLSNEVIDINAKIILFCL